MANTLFQGQSIADFYQQAQSKDFARKNLFRVLEITGGTNGLTFDSSDLVYVTTTTLPRRQINSVKVAYMGMQFNVPGTASYPGSDAWNVTFRMPADLSIRQKFEYWTRATFDDANTTGLYSMKDLGKVHLALMGKGGNPLVSYILHGVYCVSLGDYALDATDNGAVVEQQVTLAYQYWDYGIA